MTFLDAFRRSVGAIVRDKGPVMPATVAVVVYCFLYPLPYLPQTVRDIPVAVADADTSALSRELARNLDATRELEVAGVTRSVEEALPLLRSGSIGGIVSIPDHFERDVRRGSPTGVTIMGDGGLVVLDGTLLSSAGQTTAATVAPLVQARLARSGLPEGTLQASDRALPEFVKQPLFNVVDGYQSYVVTASMGLIILQLLTIAIAVVVGTWCEKGEWPIAIRGRLTPAAFLGMVAAFSVFSVCGILFWSGFVFWYHDLPRAANVGGVVAFALLYAAAISGFGVALGAWMAERERALQFVAACSVPLLMFSGFAFPVESFVAPVRWISMLFPSTPGIRGFIALNQMGARLDEVLPQIVHLAVLTAIFLAAGWLLSSWRTRQGHKNLQDGGTRTAHDGAIG